MILPLGLLPALALAAAPAGLERVPITVRETAGLRRFGFPVVAEVPFPRGALADAAHARLVDGRGREVAAQVTVIAQWPQDHSVQWVEVDFNASPAPNAVESYALEYGPTLERTRPARGVSLTETAESFQAGAYRVPRNGVPLLTSVHYGDLEYLRPDGAALTILDRTGKEQGVRTSSVRTRALKTEPICVMLEQRGDYETADHRRLAFRSTMEFPSTKSWIHLVHEIEDPEAEVQEIRLRLPFALETEPRLFDFGVGSWLYGALRSGQSATLTQRVAGDGRAGKTGWEVTLGGEADSTPYATSTEAAPRAEGWAHLMDSKKVIAIGVPRLAAAPGECSIRLAHEGECVIRWRRGTGDGGAETGDRRRELRSHVPRLRRIEAYFHFIPFPAQQTAATSPPSMLAPLVARCEPERYRKAGVATPR